MRVFCQRVLSASVSIDGVLHSSIEKGFLLLVGFTEGDTPELVERMAEKVRTSRFFEDAEGKTNLSLSDVNGSILSISQFTLYASLEKGHRPSFVKALRPEGAKPLYALFNSSLRAHVAKVGEGVFGADMKVSLVNDGPFSVLFDSDDLFPKKGE